ncbi:hypothetical protein KKF59_03295 [Patescibacteria group bacterium]|nr:hypothetical protein [Patescibacteria group bacterium]MBU1034891.1 hypothetical protein [Patescibacteria group bacterium]MBU1629649.1 hypothetical protein [Patescibacteria group bacterium]MBU1908129.1 hypothetical protein [Patescibacteria group bacterium]
MPETIAAIAPKKKLQQEPDCLIQVRAELVSLGGAVLLAVCLMLTAVLFMVFLTPTVTGAQRFIAVVLVFAAWGYFLNSISEKLSLYGDTLEFRAAFSHPRSIPLDELQAMILTHEGFNLERGLETIEFRRSGRKPDRVSLGPCWQRNKLESFLKSLEQALQMKG